MTSFVFFFVETYFSIFVAKITIFCSNTIHFPYVCGCYIFLVSKRIFFDHILKKYKNLGAKRRIHLPMCVPLCFKVFEFSTFFASNLSLIQWGIESQLHPRRWLLFRCLFFGIKIQENISNSLSSHSLCTGCVCHWRTKKKGSEKRCFFLRMNPFTGYIHWYIYCIQ